MQIETIPHLVLKCQIEHACFHGEEVGASFGVKVTQEDRTKEETRIEQPH